MTFLVAWGGGGVPQEEITFLFFWLNVQTLKHFQATLSNADRRVTIQSKLKMPQILTALIKIKELPFRC
jgi:hypothetical protein